MSRFVPSVILAVAVLGSAAALRVPAASAQASYELQVVALVNQHRASLGRPALGTDTRLFAASEGHSSWMCTNQTLSHYGAGGSTPGTRATAAGYPWFAIGETIAQGFTTPAAVVAGFQGSPSHWNILMSTSYRDIGAGYVSCDGRPRRHYWTLMVGNSRSPATPVGGGGSTPPTATSQPEPSSTAQPVIPTATSRPVLPTATSRPALPTPTNPPSGSGGGVSGTVRLQGAQTLAGTTILVDGVPRTTTSATGAFLVTGLSGGTHVVTARRGGMVDSARAVAIGGGTVSIGTTTLRAGDLDGDNAVLYADFSNLFGRWGSCAGHPNYLAIADFDADGCNGYGDYRWMYPNYRLVGPTAWQ